MSITLKSCLPKNPPAILGGTIKHPAQSPVSISHPPPQPSAVCFCRRYHASAGSEQKSRFMALIPSFLYQVSIQLLVLSSAWSSFCSCLCLRGLKPLFCMHILTARLEARLVPWERHVEMCSLLQLRMERDPVWPKENDCTVWYWTQSSEWPLHVPYVCFFSLRILYDSLMQNAQTGIRNPFLPKL